VSRRPSSTKVRRECFDRWKYADPLTGRMMMDCHICGAQIDPGKNPNGWEAEHVIRRVLSEDDGVENVRPAHTHCHKPKTAADLRENAKGRRVSDRHFGIKRRGSSFQTNRNGRFKKKMNGTVERRD
jgi:5-methylcytosine-specific restriction endonuclease McrA